MSSRAVSNDNNNSSLSSTRLGVGVPTLVDDAEVLVLDPLGGRVESEFIDVLDETDAGTQ